MKIHRPLSLLVWVCASSACAAGARRSASVQDLSGRDGASAARDATVSDGAAALAGQSMASGFARESALCRWAVRATAPAIDSSARRTERARPEPQCRAGEDFCDTVDRAPSGSDACFVSNDHIARDERAISRESSGQSVAPGRPWDHRAAPQHMDLVDRHLQFSERERGALDRDGFVGLERWSYDSYALAYHEVFRQQLPVFIGVDAIMHAMFVAHGSMLQSIEARRLRPALGRMLAALRAELRANRLQFARQTQLDLDVYLTVALSLFESDSGQPARSLFAQDEAVRALLASAGYASMQEVSLFGRQRMIDFSQLTPRGHYTETLMTPDGETTTLDSYFRTMQWLSRVEFNLVSRGCRSSAPTLDASETPREALLAVALARLVDRAGQGATLAEFERVYSVFGGKREDVSLPELTRLASAIRLQDSSAHAQLVTAIGAGHRRTARVHFAVEGAGELPAIATMFGPRIVPDTAPLTSLVHDAVAGRTQLSGADVGYLLGHTARSTALLQGDLTRHPHLRARLDAGRDQLANGLRNNRDLYSLWMSSALTLAHAREGVWPSFARTDAFADYRLNAALVTYGHIRHNYVLLAGQGYDAYGCEIPDGYVEPAVETWEALQSFARAASAIDPARRAFFARVDRVLETLRVISVRERAGLALTAVQKRWIGMVAEYIPRGGFMGDSGQPPKWTGWYFDLFADREIGAEKSAVFIADYFTLTNSDQVRYLGAHTPMLGAFVVDTNGAPRVMVGPIARGFERSGPIAERLTDEAASELRAGDAPWRASYSVSEPSLSAESVQVTRCDDRDVRVVLMGSQRGTLEVTRLDHHGDPIGEVIRVALNSAAPNTVVALNAAARAGVEGVRVRVIDGAQRRDAVLPDVIRIESGAGARFGAIEE